MLGLPVKSGVGMSGRGFRKAASLEFLSRGAWSLDAGATEKGEGILAIGWEKDVGLVNLGLQGGVLGDLKKDPNLTWWGGFINDCTIQRR